MLDAAPSIFASKPDSSRRADYTVLGAFALLKILINGLFIGRYGIQRDELYFVVCGQHLDFGYVDHAPLVPWIARLSTELFGDSVYALRVFPLLAGGLSVFLVGLLAREMGGRRFAQVLAALAAIIAPAYLRANSILHIPTFEIVFWSLAFLVLIRIVRDDKPRLWLVFGLIAGLGLLNKPTMLFLGVGVVAGLALTKHRKHFLSPWLWAGGLIAFAAFSPNLLWQWNNDWAMWRFVKQLNAEDMSAVSFPVFMLGQVLYFHPLNVVVWSAGLWFLLFAPAGKPFRVVGVACVTVFLILVIAKSKVYYLGPAYTALFAAGGVAPGNFLDARKARWPRRAVLGAMVLAGFWLGPVALPGLPIEIAPEYMQKATGGIINAIAAQEIMGDWRDQFGWEDKVEVVARVYQSLTPEERRACIVFCGNYGQASAINFYGRNHGLPYAISNSMTYYLWGPGERSGEVLIAIGAKRQGLEQIYADVVQADTFVSESVRDFENNLPVFVCRKPTAPLREAWAHIPPKGF
ncbi:MAG: glycosyltransferase family 39 protein [Candidatus Hydrogenedentales bacterium]|jgi:4-amino-4-deoxy-L-arabinose transferase-like glycosyltransferase